MMILVSVVGLKLKLAPVVNRILSLILWLYDKLYLRMKWVISTQYQLIAVVIAII